MVCHAERSTPGFGVRCRSTPIETNMFQGSRDPSVATASGRSLRMTVDVVFPQPV
jgi:hypothetical protein